jgi:hypothetical protein
MQVRIRLLPLAIIITIIFALRTEASHSKKPGGKKKHSKKYGKKYGGDYKKKPHCSKDGCRKHCEDSESSESNNGALFNQPTAQGPMIGQLRPDYVPPPIVPTQFGPQNPKPDVNDVSPEAANRGPVEDKDESASGECEYYNNGCQPPYAPTIIIQQPHGYGYGGNYGGAGYGRHRNQLTRDDRTQTTKPTSTKPKPTPQRVQNQNAQNPVNRIEEDGVLLDDVNDTPNTHNRHLARSISTPPQAAIQRQRIERVKITKDDLCPGFGGFFVMVQEVSFMQRDKGCTVITRAKSGDVHEDNLYDAIKTIVSCLGVNRAIRLGSYFGNAFEGIAMNVTQNSKLYKDHPLNTKDPLPLLCYVEPKGKNRSKHRYSTSSSSSSSSS